MMTASGSTDDNSLAFSTLTPDQLLDALESIGLCPDGRLLALNSFENRVYQIGIEDEKPLIAKFYRPGRWSDAAILEEHAFTAELVEREIPVVPPLLIGGQTLHHHAGMRFAVSAFAAAGRRNPDVDYRLSLVTSDDQVAALQRGDIDVGLLYRRPPYPPNMRYRDLRVDHYSIAVPSGHRLTKLPRVRLADLEGEPLMYTSRATRSSPLAGSTTSPPASLTTLTAPARAPPGPFRSGRAR